MGRFDYNKMQELLRDMSVDTPTHSIDYTMYPINSKSVYEENGSKLVMVKANVDVLVKETGERIVFPLDLLKLPHYGETGFIIRGKNRQVIDIYTKSYGWYIVEKSTDLKLPHLSLNSEIGRNFMIFSNDYKLHITTSKKMNDHDIPLAVFLKAFTGASYAELANKLGTDSIYVLHSFSGPEPLKSECVDMVIRNFFDDYRHGKKDVELNNMSIDDRYRLALQRLFSPQFMVLGQTTGVRMKRALSFKERCRNLTLAENISIAGKSYNMGLVLTPKILDELDYLPLNELKVYGKGKKVFTIRKTSIFNFRALGATLNKEVRTGNKVIAPGTVLTLEILKELDESGESEIYVDWNGESGVVHRNIYGGTLEVNDIISMVQVYVDTLSGMDRFDNIYDLTNQNLITVEINALNTIKGSCKVINYYIENYIREGQTDSDALIKIASLTGFDTNSLIDEISSVKAIESQQSELNNLIQKVSKENKVTKQGVKRSTAEMVSVRESQFAFLDPVDSPESSKIGTTHTKTWLSGNDSNGFLTAPYIKVSNGEIVSEDPVYLTAADKEDQYIAEWNETFHTVDEAGNKVKKEKVLALCNETIMEVPIADVGYMEYSPYQSMSPARMQTPFQEHNNPKRMLMSSNHQKQTVAPIRNERPWVSSGGDSLLDVGYFTAKDVLATYYDANQSTLGDVTKEVFLNSPIELVTIDIKKGSKDLYFKVIGFEGHSPVLNIPFAHKASSGAMFSYKVNAVSKSIYHGDDVVAHSTNLDIKKYDLFKHVDFGKMKVDPKVFDKALGLAKNLIIGYKTYESSTIDDAIVMSGELFGTDALSTVELHKETYKLSDPIVEEDKGTKEFQQFGFNGKSPYKHMTDEGLPKIGTHLKPGDVVLGVKIIKNVYSVKGGAERDSVHERPKKLEGSVEGQVVEAYISNNEAVVTLMTIKPVETGDKFAGRYGNKGVVAKIVPAEMMPFDPVSGLRLQVVLSPLGVPSRSNIGQILEVTLGFAMYKQGKVAIVSPYVGNTLDFVRGVAKDNDIKPMMLRDGRTGQWFDRPINVGVMYLLKLEHMVSHKIRGVGLSTKTDPVFNQPTKGAGHAGGQAFGEYETWCLMAVGAKRVLQDLQSVQSDDYEAIEALNAQFADNLNDIDVEGDNHNNELFQVVMRSLGVEPTIDELEGFIFKPLTDSMIRSLSTRPVDINDKDSIRSTSIFGVTTNDRARFQNRGTWSWMPLHCEIVHPIWLTKGKIERFLLVGKASEKDGVEKIELTQAGPAMLRELIAGKSYVERKYVKDELVYVFYKGNVEGRLTGMPAFVEILRNTDLGQIKRYYEAKANNAKVEKSVLEYKTKLRGVLEFEEAGLTLNDFIISSLPVMPLSFRPQDNMFKNSTQDFDYYYRRVMDEVAKYKALGREDVLGIYSIYLRIVELCGLTYGKEIKENTGYTPILKYFAKREGSDKAHGKIRDNILKKRVHFSGRTVIIPSSDTTRLVTQIGVPFLLVLEIFKPQLVSLLGKQLSHYGDFDKRDWERLLGVMGSNRTAFNDMVAEVCDRLDTTSTKIYDEIYGIIQTYVEGYKNPETGEWDVEPRVVIAGRQPSLHKFNIRAYHPIIVHSKCIELPPLTAKGYNADYDGDQMWIIALVNDAAGKEAMEKLSPKYGVINPKDNSVVLDHSQDMKLGVYFATMLHNNIDDISKDARYEMSNVRFYNSLSKLQTDLDLRYLTVHDLVIFTYKKRKYLSTAGRVLFNGILPNGLGFTDEPFSNVLGLQGIAEGAYRDLRFDGLVSGSGGSRNKPVYVNLSDVTSWSYENLDADANIAVFQAISEFGFKYSDLSGISLYIDDFVEDPNMKDKIERANAIAEVVNKRYNQGLITDETRKSLLIEVYDGCKKAISKTFMANFDRNNNIFIMFDSGARGTEGQIMQASGIIGILQKTKDETLEIPVLSNYAKGNSSYDTLLLSFSTRTGVASTQTETAVSGELTRTAVYMSSGLTIVEEDCGVGYTELKLKYGKFKDIIKSPTGENVTKRSLVGKKLAETDIEANKLLTSFLSPNHELTEKCVSLLIKHKVKTVELEDGVYSLYYELDTLMKSLLLRRGATDLPHLIHDGHISTKTIKHIEALNLDRIKVRTMLDCNSIGGVCAHCYGLRYDSNVKPNVGDLIGIESAQSIGEPAAQLVLSLFHQGGVAGASIDKGVTVLKALLESGSPSNMKGAVVPGKSGYVYYSNGDNNIRLIGDDGVENIIRLDAEPIVESGEYVYYDTPLTSGFIIPDSISELEEADIVKFKQFAMLELYFRTFELSKIKVNARHFEAFVRLQTSLVTVIDSADPEFKEGLMYELNEINQKAKGPVKYQFKVNGHTPVVVHFSGMETEMARERLADNLGVFVTEQRRSKGKSLIGNLFYGQDVTGARKKILTLPVRVKSMQSDNVVENNFLRDLEGTVASELVQVREMEDFQLADDLDALLDFDDLKPEKETSPDYINLEEGREEEATDKEAIGLNKMKLF